MVASETLRRIARALCVSAAVFAGGCFHIDKVVLIEVAGDGTLLSSMATKPKQFVAPTSQPTSQPSTIDTALELLEKAREN